MYWTDPTSEVILSNSVHVKRLDLAMVLEEDGRGVFSLGITDSHLGVL